MPHVDYSENVITPQPWCNNVTHFVHIYVKLLLAHDFPWVVAKTLGTRCCTKLDIAQFHDINAKPNLNNFIRAYT